MSLLSNIKMFLTMEELQILKGCLLIALGVSHPWAIKAALVTLGLSINFIGSLFLALYILGDERVRRIEMLIIREFSIFAALNTITSGILRKRIIGGRLLEIPLKEEDLGRPITKQVLEKYFIRPRKVLLYHFLPILLITLVSIWLIAFYVFHLSPLKAFLVALFLSLLAFSQNLYQGFLFILYLRFGGIFMLFNEVCAKSLLFRKTWREYALLQLRKKGESLAKTRIKLIQTDDDKKLLYKIRKEEFKDILTESQIDFLWGPKPFSVGQDILIFLISTAINLFFLFIWLVTALLSIPPYLWTCIVMNFPKFRIYFFF